MAGNRIISPDILDTEIVDARELASDGYDVYLSLPLTSITSGVFTVVTSGILSGGFFTEVDTPIEVDDRIFVSGATPSTADGYYVISDILSDNTFDVFEIVPDATGGTVQFAHPAGATKVGIDNTALSNVLGDNVQEALEELDAAITAGGISEAEHETLDTLVHNIAETSFEEATYAGPFNRLSNVTIWTDGTKTTKVREVNFTYTGARATTVVTIQYDELGLVQDTLTETITYVGPFTNRIDTITRVKT